MKLVEEACCSCIITLLLKLPETLFQPLYLTFLHWPSVEKQQRYIAFYTCLSKLVEKLKSLFVPFVSDSLPMITETLTNASSDSLEESPRKQDEHSLKLIECVSCLLAYLQHCDKAIDTEAYEKLAQPLIDLLTASRADGDHFQVSGINKWLIILSYYHLRLISVA